MATENKPQQQKPTNGNETPANGTPDEQQEIGTQDIRNPVNVPQKILYLPRVKEWQTYVNWRVGMYRSSLLINYIGSEDGTIVTSVNNLKNVLVAIDNDLDSGQERATYQFQTLDDSYVSRVLTSRKGTQSEGTVPFRFVRANLKRRNFVIFQNTFSVKPNSLELDELLHNSSILCSEKEIMAPLPHISLPKVSTKYKEDIRFENDVD